MQGHAQVVVCGIVVAGRLIASSINGQPWHFIVVQDKNMLAPVGQFAKTGPYIAQAPLDYGPHAAELLRSL